MSVGLFALLDDVAVIARGAAAQLDDVVAQAGKAGAKAAGVVVDDAAVTPTYVVGFAPDRELPMIGRIALGSLRNKLLILGPAALALGQFAPWAITPLLMAGGLYLAYEGAEKVLAWAAPHAAHAHEAAVSKTDDDPQTPTALEAARVSGAIKTDFILSAEIMAITLGAVAEASLAAQAAVLAAVGVGITAAVYGAVAVIVKLDDLGLRLVRLGGLWRPVGRALVAGMPGALALLSAVGAVAMLWVGGGILLHGLAAFGLGGLEHGLDALARRAGEGAAGWLVRTLGAGLFGLAAGLAAIPLIGWATRLRR